MKYRQREETVRGDSPWVDVNVNSVGTEARVRVRYHRTSTAKDVQTDTHGTLDLGWLELDDLACVARSMIQALSRARRRHTAHVTGLLDSIDEVPR